MHAGPGLCMQLGPVWHVDETFKPMHVRMQPNRLAELCFSRLCPLWCGRWPWGTGGTDPSSALQRTHRLMLQNPATVMNKGAICDIGGVPRSALKHVHSTNRFNESVPYFIALDEKHKAVVISIRGTLRCVRAGACLLHTSS
jgi:hypothetical protein